MSVNIFMQFHTISRSVCRQASALDAPCTVCHPRRQPQAQAPETLHVID